MREIEFRVYVKDKHKMYEVKEIDFNYKCVKFEEENKPTDTMRMFDQIELMQYTGEKDKHGKKIFESDIVLVNGKHIDIVRYSCGCFLMEKQMCYYEFTYQNFQSIEIIGNIYDNPELLNGE